MIIRYRFISRKFAFCFAIFGAMLIEFELHFVSAAKLAVEVERVKFSWSFTDSRQNAARSRKFGEI